MFFSGAVSGICSRTLTAPLDRIKLVLQAGSPKCRKGSSKSFAYSGGRNAPIVEIARGIIRDGGLRAFWQGNGANVLKVMPESAVKFLASVAI